jgi:hypothetical protein
MNSRANPAPAMTPVTIPACRELCCPAGCKDTSATAGIAIAIPAPAPAELKNLLQILGLDSAPGLVIDDSRGRLS